MHGGVDPEAFQPAIPERAGIAEGRLGAALGKPSVPAQRRLQLALRVAGSSAVCVWVVPLWLVEIV
jgi:hypothetical protein